VWFYVYVYVIDEYRIISQQSAAPHFSIFSWRLFAIVIRQGQFQWRGQVHT
jgi:hypothetical protein